MSLRERIHLFLVNFVWFTMPSSERVARMVARGLPYDVAFSLRHAPVEVVDEAWEKAMWEQAVAGLEEGRR